MFCSNYTALQLNDLEVPVEGNNNTHSESRKNYCPYDNSYVNWGNLQYEWIKDTLAEWAENDYIVWKAVV